MADLDSFFAKKDKKKLKGRKYDNADDISKRLKESEKKLEKERTRVEIPKKIDDSLTKSTSITDQPKDNSKKDEEEWKEYIDDSQKDLTDLKISKLQIEDDEDYVGYGSGEDGEAGSGGNNAADGVWNKNQDKNEDVVEDQSEIVVAPSLSKEDRNSTYVPPHQRNSMQSSAPKNSRKSKTAPDISNAMAFPSLSDAQTNNPGQQWGRRRIGEDRGFESVKHGSTKAYSNVTGALKLSTTNRFDALGDS